MTLNQTEVELTDENDVVFTKFTIVHDFEKIEGNINTFSAALTIWQIKTDDYSPESFIAYVKSKEPHRTFMTLEEYNKLSGTK